MLEEVKDKLSGEADVDDKLIGGDTQGNKRRNLEAKSAVRVCVEKFESGNVNFSDLENFELEP